MDRKEKLNNGKLIKKLETCLKSSKNLGDFVHLSPATLDFLVIGISRYQRTLGVKKPPIVDTNDIKAYIKRRVEELSEYQKLSTPCTSAEVYDNPMLMDATPNFYFVVEEKLRQELEFLA